MHVGTPTYADCCSTTWKKQAPSLHRTLCHRPRDREKKLCDSNELVLVSQKQFLFDQLPHSIQIVGPAQQHSARAFEVLAHLVRSIHSSLTSRVRRCFRKTVFQREFIHPTTYRSFIRAQLCLIIVNFVRQFDYRASYNEKIIIFNPIKSLRGNIIFLLSKSIELEAQHANVSRQSIHTAPHQDTASDTPVKQQTN